VNVLWKIREILAGRETSLKPQCDEMINGYAGKGGEERCSNTATFIRILSELISNSHTNSFPASSLVLLAQLQNKNIYKIPYS
jgi:hypothetical protein